MNFGGSKTMTVNFNGMSIMDMPLMNAYANMGMNTGMYGMGYGMGVGMMNPQGMMTNIQQWDDFGVNRQVATFRNQNNAQFQMQAQNGSIQRQAQILAQEIKTG